MNIKQYMNDLGSAAKAASRVLAASSTEIKNNALKAIAQRLEQQRNSLIQANQIDMDKGRASAWMRRFWIVSLIMRIDGMIEGLAQVVALPDPVGELTDLGKRPSGINLSKMRVPLGVVGIIYESRPNVTIDAASLCLKSGNATILRGGSEAIESNQAIARCISQGLVDAGLPESAVQVVATTDRAAVGELITMTEYVDVIVPRGGKSLIERISSDARVPVIKHLDGNCHVYIDGEADRDKAIAIAVNAKTHRYGVCNAMESLLIDKSLAESLLPELASIYAEKQVELRGCAKSCAIVSSLNKATEEDWYQEYLAPVLAVKIVSGIEEAITHINRYGSGHTESIVTEDADRGKSLLLKWIQFGDGQCLYAFCRWHGVRFRCRNRYFYR